jgi:hypothetical protein
MDAGGRATQEAKAEDAKDAAAHENPIGGQYTDISEQPWLTR